jgi:hypothetical protein
MKLLAFVSGLLGLVLAAGPGWAQCTSAEDLAAVAATRQRVAQQCPCATAISDGAYKKCALGVANMDVTVGHCVGGTNSGMACMVDGDCGGLFGSCQRLPQKCRRVVAKCAAKSICGRPIGYHPCCKTNRLGKTRCKIILPGLCKSGPGGSHCVSFTEESCCDACTGPGMCASPSGAFVEPAD